MTTILPKDSLRVISYNASIADSDGRPVPGTSRERNLIFNITQISEEEVKLLIENDSWEFDPRIVSVSSAQLKHIKDKK